MAGTVTGENLLVERYPIGNSTKTFPVSSTLLKEHLQVTGTHDDTLITDMAGYLAAATDEVESLGGVSLIRQKRIQYISEDLLADLEGVTVHLCRGPIVSVTAVKYLDSDGATQTLGAALYRSMPLFRAVYFIGPFPILADGPGTMWIEYESGYGETASTVPAAWVNCVMTLAMRKYDFRGADSGSTNDSWWRMFRQMIRNAGDSSHYA